MLENPYEFTPQPQTRFWRRTLIAWLVVVVAGAGGLAYCARAGAAEVFRGFDRQGGVAALKLQEEPCTNKAVMEQLRKRALDVRRFKAAVLTYGGRDWASCWIDLDDTVLSIDEEGAPFQPVPRHLFKDNSI